MDPLYIAVAGAIGAVIPKLLEAVITYVNKRFNIHADITEKRENAIRSQVDKDEIDLREMMRANIAELKETRAKLEEELNNCREERQKDARERILLEQANKRLEKKYDKLKDYITEKFPEAEKFLKLNDTDEFEISLEYPVTNDQNPPRSNQRQKTKDIPRTI